MCAYHITCTLALIKLGFLSLVSLYQGNVKKSEQLMKIVNIDGEILYIIWTTWGISMKLSGKMWIMIILKVSKNQGFTLQPRRYTFGKTTGGGGKLTPSLLRVRVNLHSAVNLHSVFRSPMKSRKFHYLTLIFFIFSEFLVTINQLLKKYDKSNIYAELPSFAMRVTVLARISRSHRKAQNPLGKLTSKTVFFPSTRLRLFSRSWKQK